QRGPLPIDQACAAIRQAALGLQHAFEKGVIHRDIKPSNLLRTNTGLVKILDFGLAHHDEVAGGSATPLTNKGQLLGTPDFLAPEQSGAPGEVHIRSDLYSLACPLSSLLTGKVPSPGGPLMDNLAAQRFAEPVPLTQRRTDVPAAVAAVVHRLMAKNPDER